MGAGGGKGLGGCAGYPAPGGGTGYPAPAGTGKGPLDSLDLNPSICNFNVLSNTAQCSRSLRGPGRLLAEEDFSSIPANSTELQR